jgi:hypothetical protein
MKWVKFSERFPQHNDESSVSTDNQVVVRGRYSDGGWYFETERLDTIVEFYDSDASIEWLEGAFEVEVNK